MISTDRFIPHVSTVPATRGQTVGLFVREKALRSTIAPGVKPHVVVMVHGGFAPSIAAYDLPYRDYSFMDALARAGFDVFAMSHTGYGPSPRPLMDDPCNVEREFQPELIPHVLKEIEPPRYAFKLVSSVSEWDELETLVDWIMGLRKVDKVSFVGWSTGAPRAGGYAALHPERVDKIVLFGPAPFFPTDDAPAQMPEAGAPAILQSREFLLHRRWQDHVRCEGQLEDPEVCSAVWSELMALDEVGARWGAGGQGIMRAPSRTNFGWRANLARIGAPTLMMLGEFDNYAKRLEAWRGLGAEHKLSPALPTSCSSSAAGISFTARRRAGSRPARSRAWNTASLRPTHAVIWRPAPPEKRSWRSPG